MFHVLSIKYISFRVSINIALITINIYKILNIIQLLKGRIKYIIIAQQAQVMQRQTSLVFTYSLN